MCGIVGVIGGTTKAQEKAVRHLIEVDTIRGYHSTGVVKVNYFDKAEWFKKAVNGIEFFEYAKADNILNGRAVIAHNRQATKGKVNHANAHPFQYGEFTGVHNGTLYGQHHLPDHKMFDVDSENIYYSFSKIGVDETIKNLDGAYALVWFNEAENTINMIRNDQRPLHYCYSSDKKNVYFASEGKMLEWILHKNGIKHDPVILLPINTLTTFAVPTYGKKVLAPTVRTVKSKFDEKKCQKCLPAKKEEKKEKGQRVSKLSVKRQLKPFLGEVMEFQGGGTEINSFGRPYYKLLPLEDITVDGKDIEIRVVNQSLLKKCEDHSKNEGTFEAMLARNPDCMQNPKYIVIMEESLIFLPPEEEEEFYHGYMDSLLTEAEWREATKKGCAWCGSPADIKEDNQFFDDKEFLCPSCSELDEVKAYVGL